MDPYVRAYVSTRVRIDAGARVWDGDTQVEVHRTGGQRKVFLPVAKYPLSFDDLKKMGARCEVITVMSLALAGAEGRWRENIEQRQQRGIPSNVYIANARTIERALERGEHPPDVRWVGRTGHKATEVYDTVDEVVQAMSENRWRTDYRRGRYAKKGAKK